jgi:hypothetical protein
MAPAVQAGDACRDYEDYASWSCGLAMVALVSLIARPLFGCAYRLSPAGLRATFFRHASPHPMPRTLLRAPDIRWNIYRLIGPGV